MPKGDSYSSNQLRVLHYLKRNGPLVRTSKKDSPGGKLSLYTQIAEACGIADSTVRNCLKQLEDRCVVLRTWAKGRPKQFQEGQGNPCVRIELVDPKMTLPEPPKPLPPIVIDARINEELYEMTIIEPSPDAVILALLERNEELQEQINRLQDIVQQLTQELQKKDTRREVPKHLSSRIQTALTPEQWDALRHSAKR